MEPHRIRMVPALKERGLWEYEPFRDDYGSETVVREKMYCFRHYRRYWKDMGWIGEGRSPGSELEGSSDVGIWCPERGFGRCRSVCLSDNIY